MEETFLPLVRQFSAIEGLQSPYTLVYSLDTGEAEGCRLTLCRTGAAERIESIRLAAAPEYCYRLLRFLCENVVQPEVWQDVIAELYPPEKLGEKGVGIGEH